MRGTKWLVTDTCTTTTTRVTQGAVTVRDTVRKRTVVVRKGGRYVALEQDDDDVERAVDAVGHLGVDVGRLARA